MRRVIGVNKGFIAKITISHIAIHSTTLKEDLHIVIIPPHFLNERTQIPNESITATIIKPQLEMTQAG